MDEDGLVVDALAERLEGGLRPKLLYVIPEYQNPTGWTLPLERREALVELCRRHGVLILEDVAYREMAFGARAAAVAVVARPRHRAAGRHVLEDLLPRRAARLGGRTGRGRRQLAAAKQLTDQCAGGLGQRMVEEYGRAGHFGRQAPARPRALRVALARAVRGWSASSTASAPGASRPAASSAGSRCPRASTPSSCARPPSRRA